MYQKSTKSDPHAKFNEESKMPRFIIDAEYTKKYTKELVVYAKTEEEAQEQGEEIISKWDDVVDVDVSNIRED